MTSGRLKRILAALSSLILYVGVGLGLLMAMIGVAAMLGVEQAERAHWGVGLGAGLVIAFQALVLGGALKLLVGIDDRLERLEKKG